MLLPCIPSKGHKQSLYKHWQNKQPGRGKKHANRNQQSGPGVNISICHGEKKEGDVFKGLFGVHSMQWNDLTAYFGPGVPVPKAQPYLHE